MGADYAESGIFIAKFRWVERSNNWLAVVLAGLMKAGAQFGRNPYVDMGGLKEEHYVF